MGHPSLVSLVRRVGLLRWVQRLHKRLLTSGPFDRGQLFERKRQGTEKIHPRRRVIEKAEQALADVIAFADVDQPLPAVDRGQTRGIRGTSWTPPYVNG
jgi:hypothetical protein